MTDFLPPNFPGYFTGENCPEAFARWVGSPPMKDDLRRAVADLEAPFAVLDLDAALDNAADLVRRASAAGRDVPVRLASKSLRIRPLMERVLALPGYRGVLSFHLSEALWLVDELTSDNVLVAYPCAHRDVLARWMGEQRYLDAVTVMVDSAEHLELLDTVYDQVRPSARLRVCLDIDAGLRLGPLRIGAKRSPVHAPRQAAHMAQQILARPHLKLVGLMAYEGQIAGTTDTSRAVALMKKLSVRELAPRRAKILRAVRDAGATEIEFINGGGTGSIETTSAEDSVTEIGAGSGIIGSALFDHYASFRPQPAEWFVLPVVRRPGRRTVTVAGGGRVGSGPPGTDRLPVVDWPEGLSMARLEGPGEVQTPLMGAAAASLRLGDHVWFRAAKAGEPTEFADEVIVVSGGRIIDRWPTYRGESRSFV